MDATKSKEWSFLATGCLLRASFLTGEERIIAQIAAEGTAMHGMYAEANALGEVRGFSLNSNEALVAEELKGTKGALVLQQIMSSYTKPFLSYSPYEGNIISAWQQYSDLSEQLPSFMHIESRYNDVGIPQFVG